MRKLILLAGLALGACAGPYYGGYGGGVAYDGYYDNYYGPISGGYWDGDAFWYRNHRGGRYIRDDGRHFRRDGGPGFNAWHGRGPGPRRGGDFGHRRDRH